MEIINNILKLFRSDNRPERLLWIRETKTGIETYINPKINVIDTTTKVQLIAFLESAVKRLK